jgi:hypothetical protein
LCGSGWPANLNWVAGAVLALAFLLRLKAALGTFLNPDEALHFLIVNQPTLGGAYRASLTSAHPPLYFVLLYFWRFTASSEVMLRLPSVLAGTAAAWFVFQWVRTVLGTTAGLVALILTAFAPPLIGLSAEVRGYAILLLFLAASLYFAERVFRERTSVAVARYSLFFYLAIVTHYSALWFAMAMGIYFLLRIRELPTKIAALWAAFQVGAAAVYGVLYVTHISKINGSAMQSEAMNGWLQALYFTPGQKSVGQFLFRNTGELFDYLFAHPIGGIIASLVFGFSVLRILSGTDRGNVHAPRAFWALLVLPFLINGIAALEGLYPYGGTRHCIYLILFTIAGVSYALAQATNSKVWPVLGLAALILPVWHLKALRPAQQMPAESQRLSLMNDAIVYLRQSAPAEGPIFTDDQARGLLSYYLGRDTVPRIAESCDGFRDERYGQYRVISHPAWQVKSSELFNALDQWRRDCRDQLSVAWVFVGGFEEVTLAGFERAPIKLVSDERRFGEALSVFRLSLP